MSFAFNEKNEAKFIALQERYPDKNALVLPCLWMVQEQEKWISLEAMQYLARRLECSAIDIYSTASFYTMFNLKPIGKYHIQLCKNIACMLKGSKQLSQHIQHKLGIQSGQTTKDGKFTFSLVQCLGSCGTAPCMSLNDDYKVNLTPEKIDEILDNLEP